MLLTGKFTFLKVLGPSLSLCRLKGTSHKEGRKSLYQEMLYSVLMFSSESRGLTAASQLRLGIPEEAF